MYQLVREDGHHLSVVWNLSNSHFLFPQTFTGHSQKTAKMSDNPVKEEVENFNRRSLKKTETKVNTSLPTKEGECALNIFCSVPHSRSTIVSKDFWVIVKSLRVHAQLPFTLPFLFCYQDATEKGSDLIYEELHFMTFAPGNNDIVD